MQTGLRIAPHVLSHLMSDAPRWMWNITPYRVFIVVNWKERIQNATVGVWSVEIKEVRAVAARVRSKAHQLEMTI